MIIKEQYTANNVLIVTSIVIITLSVFFGYRYLDLHHHKYNYEKISVVIWVPISALLCHTINIYLGLGSVLAAGIIGVIASLIPKFNSQSNYLKQLPSVIYCGAFVGMSGAQITPSISFVIAAGSITTLLYMVSKNLFLGIGGKLGALAFAGVIIVSLIHWLYL